MMAAEATVLSSAVIVGLVAGMINLRDSINAESEDLAEAIGSLDQSFAYDGLRSGSGSARVGGSGFVDSVDTNAGDGVAFKYVPSDFSESEVSLR